MWRGAINDSAGMHRREDGQDGPATEGFQIDDPCVKFLDGTLTVRILVTMEVWKTDVVKALVPRGFDEAAQHIFKLSDRMGQKVSEHVANMEEPPPQAVEFQDICKFLMMATGFGIEHFNEDLLTKAFMEEQRAGERSHLCEIVPLNLSVGR